MVTTLGFGNKNEDSGGSKSRWAEIRLLERQSTSVVMVSKSSQIDPFPPAQMFNVCNNMS